MKKLILSVLLLSFFMLGCRTENMEKLLNKQEYKLAANPKITICFDNGSVFL